MQLERELVDELGLLKRYSMNSSAKLDFIASPDSAISAAAGRLLEKGIINNDGGLTESGLMAIEHMNRLLNQLSPPLEPI